MAPDALNISLRMVVYIGFPFTRRMHISPSQDFFQSNSMRKKGVVGILGEISYYVGEVFIRYETNYPILMSFLGKVLFFLKSYYLF